MKSPELFQEKFDDRNDEILKGRTIVKAFVEFRRETSNTKSSSHAESKT